MERKIREERVGRVVVRVGHGVRLEVSYSENCIYDCSLHRNKSNFESFLILIERNLF